MTRPARVRLRNGKLYSGRVELDGPWAHVTDGWRLGSHMGVTYSATPIGDISVRARDVEWIRWRDRTERAL